MHDGASVHQAYIIRDLLAEMGFHVMEWPPYSPDLESNRKPLGVDESENL